MPESRPSRPSPEPLQVDAGRVVAAGAVLWFVAFCVLLVVGGHRLWLWTTLAGWVLGLIGLVLARLQRRAAARRSAKA